MSTAPFLPKGTDTLIRRYVRRQRAIQIMRAITIASAIVLIWLIVTSIADRYVSLPMFARSAVELGIIGVVAVVLFHSLKQLWAAIPWSRAAMEIEQCSQRFDGRLQTIVSQSLESPDFRGSAALLQVLTGQVDGIALQIRPASLAHLQPIRGPMTLIGFLFIVLSLMAMREPRVPALMLRELLPLSDRTAVTATILQVLPGNAVRPAGKSLTIVVHATGLSDSVPMLQFHQDDPVFSSALMSASENDFVYRFASIDRPLTYRVLAGDATSPTYLIKLDAGKITGSSRQDTSIPTTNTPINSAAVEAYLRAIGR